MIKLKKNGEIVLQNNFKLTIIKKGNKINTNKTQNQYL